MKKILYFFIALALCVSAMAQDQQRRQRPQNGNGPRMERRMFNPEELAKRTADSMKERCKLTDEQYAKVVAYFAESNKKMQAERDSIMKKQQQEQQQQRSFNREAMQKRMAEHQAALKEIMTDEQYAEYQKMQQERRNRGQRR
ncbi:MAG: DUF4890 domain-containing protein [Prevotella sp.]|nr:DUF4890 domain-containing protein [Candidatus Prevotella equi]